MKLSSPETHGPARARSKWNIDSRPYRDWFRVSIWECREGGEKECCKTVEWKRDTREGEKRQIMLDGLVRCFLHRPIKALICSTINDVQPDKHSREQKPDRGREKLVFLSANNKNQISWLLISIKGIGSNSPRIRNGLFPLSGLAVPFFSLHLYCYYFQLKDRYFFFFRLLLWYFVASKKRNERCGSEMERNKKSLTVLISSRPGLSSGEPWSQLLRH